MIPELIYKGFILTPEYDANQKQWYCTATAHNQMATGQGKNKEKAITECKISVNDLLEWD